MLEKHELNHVSNTYKVELVKSEQLNHLRRHFSKSLSSFQKKRSEFARSFARRVLAENDDPKSESDDPVQKMHRVETVLFVSREPLNTRQISKLADLVDGTEARTLIREINRRYRDRGRAFRIQRVAGGYQFLTKPQVSTWVRRLHGVKDEAKLSDPAMESLAIIAYRQPILRADIEQIRGVSCGEVLRQLMERKFIKISGRSEELGRPFLYATTKFFLKYFGLDKLEDLPKSDYFKKTTDNKSNPDSLTHQSAEDFA